ncbi:MAG: sodium:solute symporter family protein [Cyanobacteria bacterium P01_A01_bin.135]
MSIELWTAILACLSFAGYVYLGWRFRVKSVRGFFVADQSVPALANGVATAADWMSAASFISMAGLISFLGYDGSIYILGWTGGYVLLALLVAPYLRKCAKYTIPDFIGDRYDSDAVRMAAAQATIFVSVIYIAGQVRGIGIVFSRFLQVDISIGVTIGLVLIAFFTILGGMKSITWTQVAQYCVLIVAYLIPAFALSALLTNIFIPQLGFTFSDILERLNGLQSELGFAEYTQPFHSRSMIDVLAITLTLMIGTAGLPHIVVRTFTVPNVRAARFSVAWALLFIAILYTTAPALAGFARYNLVQSLQGKTAPQIQQLDWTSKWENTGLLTLEDKDGDGFLRFTPDEQTNEITIDQDIIVLSTPEVANLSPMLVGLVAVGGLAAAISTASGLLLVIASSMSHDIWYRIINPDSRESHRLTASRVTVGLAIAIAGYFGINPPGFVAQTVAFAFGLASASLFPAIILGIFDKRANGQGAIAGMLVGLLFTTYYIIGANYYDVPTWVLGISPEGIGVVGMALNLVTAVGVSRLTAPPSEQVSAMVDDLRMP